VGVGVRELVGVFVGVLVVAPPIAPAKPRDEEKPLVQAREEAPLPPPQEYPL